MNRHLSVNVTSMCNKRSQENTQFDEAAVSRLAKFSPSHTMDQHLNSVTVSAVVCCPSS